MNVNEQRLETLEKNYHALLTRVNRLDQSEKKLDFIARDSSVKIGIAEGLAETTYKELSQVKLELHQVRAEIKELRTTSGQNFEDMRYHFDRQETAIRETHDLVHRIEKSVLETNELVRQFIAKRQ
ncbi:MAG TPA: hypothetical protein VN207_00725 [Ktedonobacteraceae bacterium]|nr:hypothetical protein [Ktedonobacteraceae bacterium]